MANLNKIQFLLFVSLVIFPARAFDAIISGAHQHFKQRTEIKTYIEEGENRYAGLLNPLKYEVQNGTSNVIVYIIDRSRYVEIIRNAVCGIRLRIAEELKQFNYELVFLGIEHFDDDEHDSIGAFLLETIHAHPSTIIEVIGENRFNRSYHCHFVNFERYQEKAHICGGALLARLKAFKRGALRPVESNDNKLIKLSVYLPPEYFAADESTWSVRVINNTYSPEATVNPLEHNFGIHHPDKKICLLVLDGMEYSRVTVLKNQSPQKRMMRKFLKRMAKDNELLYIIGAFNFDWYDVYLVTEIILKHTKVLKGSDYNVFACGFGMFNTRYYQKWYDNDGRVIREAQDNALNLRKVLVGEVKERVISMHYFRNGWQNDEIPINLGNGQYIPLREFDNFTFSWPNRRIAFIVYDSAEVNDPIDYRTLNRSVEELGRSDICVVVIQAINFGLYDIHIIAEWIEKHRGRIVPERIAVLGGGTFDTIFQSQRNAYNTFFNIQKNELKAIRNAFVQSGNEKKILLANIDNANFEAWSYSMNTVVNGFYEPDLIPDKNIFNTTNRRCILFIITSAYNFQQIAAIPKAERVALSFRIAIDSKFPDYEWSVFLVGLDNFREKDSHRFAEFVKMQTNDERQLVEFVRVFNYGINNTMYRYKNTAPFTVGFHGKILECFTYFFGRQCSLSGDTCYDH